jgi:2-oxoglutarate ferredoxin oxidoreductase subunit delta
MARKGRIEINRERCKGCYLCVRACPSEHIIKDTEMNSQGTLPAKAGGTAGACIACENCCAVCPDMCITLYEVTD